MHRSAWNLQHGRYFMTDREANVLAGAAYCYYYLKNWSVLQDRYDTEHYSHEWESGACWGTLFVFWQVDGESTAGWTNRMSRANWMTERCVILHCNLPIISNSQDKQSHFRMGGKKESGVAETLCIHPSAHMHSLPLRSSKIHSKSRSWLTSNSPRYKSNQNEKKI